MTKKRQFLIEDGKITNMFDTNESIGDQMLLNVLNEKIFYTDEVDRNNDSA